MVDTYKGERVVFILTEADVKGYARQMGFPEESITEDVLEQVKKGVEWGA